MYFDGSFIKNITWMFNQSLKEGEGEGYKRTRMGACCEYHWNAN